MTEYVLTVPDDIYRRARRIAEQSRQPVDAVLIDHLRTLAPPMPALAPQEENELEALHHLSDDALWTIARERSSAEEGERLKLLMDKNTQGTISSRELNELEQLVERGEKLMLRKSQASALLAQRGHTINSQSLAPRD
jgi:hypothetical protein